MASSFAHGTRVAPREAMAASAGLAGIVGVCGLLANVAYALGASELLGDVATPIIASLFGPLDRRRQRRSCICCWRRSRQRLRVCWRPLPTSPQERS